MLRFRQERESQGLSRREMAKRMGFAKQTIALIENRCANPWSNFKQKAGEVLGFEDPEILFQEVNSNDGSHC